jgi:hypothetical protein
MTKFGGAFTPVHFVGAMAEGTVLQEGLNLSYNIGVGNGRGKVITESGDFGDGNNNRAWLVNLSARPDKFYRLQFGGSVYRDSISQTGQAAVGEWIQSGHLVWDRENPEVIVEFANVTHKPQAGVTSHSQAAYVQLAYRLPLLASKWKPYYRYDYVHIPKSDFAFRAVQGLSGSTAGVRYDLSNFTALKLEYRHFKRPGVPLVNGIVGQTSFTF